MVKYSQQDINCKNTKMNNITNWEEVNQKKKTVNIDTLFIYFGALWCKEAPKG